MKLVLIHNCSALDTEEYFREEANHKVDVYGFGVVLLELATGREEKHLVEWAWRRHQAGLPLHNVVDEKIQDRALYVEDAVLVFQLGVICTDEDPQLRPSMSDVLQQLISISMVHHQAAV